MKTQNNDELMHYGTLGMKWGHRKAGYRASTKKMNRPSRDTYAKGRIERAGSVKKAKQGEGIHLAAKSAAKGAAWLAGNAAFTALAVGSLTNPAMAALVAVGKASVAVTAGSSIAIDASRSVRNINAIDRVSKS